MVGTWLACRAAAGPMRDAGYGRILTLASALGLVGSAGRAVLLVTGPQSSYLTGTVLPVDGGWTSHRPETRQPASRPKPGRVRQGNLAA